MCAMLLTGGQRLATQARGSTTLNAPAWLRGLCFTARGRCASARGEPVRGARMPGRAGGFSARRRGLRRPGVGRPAAQDCSAGRARRGSQSPADRPPAGHRRVYGLLAGARPGPGRPERRARAGHPGAVRAGGQHPVADQRPRGRLGARRDPVRRRRAAHPERADRWRPRGRARLRRLQQRWRPGRQDRPGRWQPRQSPRQPDQHAGVPAREVAGQQPGSGGVVMRALSSAIRSSAIPAAKLLRLPVMAAVLLAPARAPAVTPQKLAQIAMGERIIPFLQPHTAPPRGRDGLVGLPEWFWIPRPEWGPISRTVTAGPVWARATAVPVRIVFVPGGGQTGISCRGPGTPYQPSLPLSAQRTDCSYTYKQPSAGQPGNAYAATVTVLWNVFWVGSGNTGGHVANSRPVGTPLTLPVAAGEALVTR